MNTCSSISPRAKILCAAVALLMACTPPVVQTIIVEPKPEKEPYAEITSEKIPEEIARLRDLLNNPSAPEWRDTTLRIDRFKIAEDLFRLTVHHMNPAPDYDKALAYSRYLSANIPAKKVYYSSWEKIILDRFEVSRQRDSLLAAIDSLSGKSKDARFAARKQSTEIDSLNAIIHAQQTTIKKLQQLDMQMEQDRSRIQN